MPAVFFAENMADLVVLIFPPLLFVVTLVGVILLATPARRWANLPGGAFLYMTIGAFIDASALSGVATGIIAAVFLIVGARPRPRQPAEAPRSREFDWTVGLIWALALQLIGAGLSYLVVGRILNR